VLPDAAIVSSSMESPGGSGGASILTFSSVSVDGTSAATAAAGTTLVMVGVELRCQSGPG
jgi:hypothetical protein